MIGELAVAPAFGFSELLYPNSSIRSGADGWQEIKE